MTASLQNKLDDLKDRVKVLSQCYNETFHIIRL